MPDKLKRHMLRMSGGKLYLPAAMRLVWVRDDEEGRNFGFETEIVEGGHEAGFATVRGVIRDPAGRILATGHKTESRQDFPAGWVEKAETGAIARALAMLGFGTQFSEELISGDELKRPADAPRPQAPPKQQSAQKAAAPAEQDDKKAAEPKKDIPPELAEARTRLQDARKRCGAASINAMVEGAKKGLLESIGGKVSALTVEQIDEIVGIVDKAIEAAKAKQSE
jgi:hypothetical protein